MFSRLWVVSELYYPEESATGYILTALAEQLAKRFPVRVLCGQPSYLARGQRSPAREVRHNVLIQRSWGTTFSKDFIPARLANIVTLSVSLFLSTLLSVRRDDQVLVVTNPPLLPFLVALACRLRRAQCLLLIHDVYPEVLVATHTASASSWLVRIVGWFSKRLYQSVTAIIVLGRDMQRLVERRLGRPSDRIVIIPNWAEVEAVQPRPRATNPLLSELNLLEKFVVQYSGNMGRTHGLETLVACAERMRAEPDVHFLLVGNGARRQWLEESVRAKALRNVTLLDRRPRADLEHLLNACDVSVISFMPKMAGVSVPSRMYNVLAAGKPIVAVADLDSELAQLVSEEGVGWLVPPLASDQLADAIRVACADRASLVAMGVRARQVAVEKYSQDQVIERYSALVAKLANNAAPLVGWSPEATDR